MRGLLERLAAPRPLVLCLDDLHWADPASLDLLAALARRPPARPVLIAFAYREGPGAGLARRRARRGRARRPGRAARARAAHRAEAAALAAATSRTSCTRSAAATRSTSSSSHGARPAAGTPGPPAWAPAPPGFPPPSRAALAGELAALPGAARRVLEAAAVAGEPFEPDLVAEVAALDEDETLAALDALLEPALIRPTPVPRRFAFRHPVVRHAVYAAAPGAWRLQAHARAAAALERRGAGPVERAHHVAHAARRGDRAAVDLLAAAADGVFQQAPATAAHHLECALRLLPDDDGVARERIELLQSLAYALLGAGRLEEAHDALGRTLELVPQRDWERRALLLCSQTSLDAWSGRPVDEPLRRLRAALEQEPATPSAGGFALRMPLAGMELMELRLDRVAAIATEALALARELRSRRHEHAALAMLALGQAAAGRAGPARAALDRALALFAAAEAGEIGQHSQGFWDLGCALHLAGRHEEAVAQLRRAVAIDRRTGHGYFIPVLLSTQLPPLLQLGRVTEAVGPGRRPSRPPGRPGTPACASVPTASWRWPAAWPGTPRARCARRAKPCASSRGRGCGGRGPAGRSA